jgi:type VI secretion system secreted protein VgrG
MMYNNETMPPYELPGNQTMSGIVSRSSKDGKPENFNEFVMEDLKGKEYVRLQSELDYIEIIKNNSVTCVGMDLDPKAPGGKGAMSDAEPVELKPKPKGGNLTQTIWNDKTETIKEGNDTQTVEKGDQFLNIDTGSRTVKIKTDRTETIEGKSKLTVTGNLTETVKQGNYSHKTSLGKITMEAMQSIELKVGGSSIKIEPASITIKSPMIKIDGSGMVQVKSGGMTEVKGQLVMVKGTMTLIN